MSTFDGNQITADGTYTVPLLVGKRYTLAAGGDFGSGSLAINWRDSLGNSGAYSGSPATADKAFTFTAATALLDLILTGATAPELTLTVALADAVTGSVSRDGTDVDDSFLQNIGAVGIDPASAVVVPVEGTDAQRGVALVAAYAAAKLLTPNGAALSATNRAQVILPPGKYKVATTFILDAEFVDLVALVPSPPSRRLPTDDDVDPNALVLDTTSFRPHPTLIYTEAELTNTVEQTADDIRLDGFSIAQLGSLANFIDLGVPEWGAFMVGDCDNTNSQYTNMYFWCGGVAYAVSGGVRAWEDFSGTWINCVANGASFRLGYGDQVTPTATFTARMFDCEAGPYSFIGDYYSGRKPQYAARNCRFERCSVIGTVYGGEDGGSGFAGCTTVGVNIESTAWFVDCVAGDKSFGIGVTNAGNFIRCRGGALCFGASGGSDLEPAVFSGYAEDCIAGPDSFGGRDSLTDSIAANCKLTGTLVRCIGTGNTRAINIDGATIRDCRITNTTTGQDCLNLLDSDSSITGSELIVLQGGTGLPVDAGSAFNVVVAGCRMNNATNDADGLGANVTNLVSSAGNIVSNSIR